MKRFKHKAFIASMMLALSTSSVIAKEGDSHAAAITNIDHSHWVNKLTLSGAMEVEFGQAEDFAGNDASDIVLATVELGFEAVINDRINANLTFLYEEDDTAFEVDEGAINVMLNDHYSLSMGQMYLPFGAYETNMVSDTLTLEIGEMRESAIALSFESGGLYGTVFINNGEMTEATAEEKVDGLGFSLGYGAERDGGLIYDFGLDYINNLGDSDGVAAVIQANSGTTVMNQYVGAYIIHANMTFGSLNIIAEYLAATDKFAVTELAYKGAGAEPTALNIEMAFSTELSDMPATLGISYQATEESAGPAGLGLPESRILAALSLEVMENTALSFEITQSDDYGVADGGTGNDATSLTAQFAVGF